MMHQVAADNLRKRFGVITACAKETAGDRRSMLRHVDMLLDQYLDWSTRATMWDADQWGLDPDHWLKKERQQLAARGGRDWPSEVI